jgi:hypothetical protein
VHGRGPGGVLGARAGRARAGRGRAGAAREPLPVVRRPSPRAAPLRLCLAAAHC